MKILRFSILCFASVAFADNSEVISHGTYETTMNDASGKPVNDRGKYIAVWEKSADGKWKCGADIWNTDLPAVPAEKK